MASLLALVLMRRDLVPPIPCLGSLCLSPKRQRSFSGKLVGSFLQHAFACGAP